MPGHFDAKMQSQLRTTCLEPQRDGCGWDDAPGPGRPCWPGSLQEDGEDSRSGRNISEFEHMQDLEVSSHLPLLPTAPWGSQVCLHSWAEVSWPFKFHPHFPD